MSEQAVTKAFLRRFRDTMLAGQFKDEVDITGGTISGVTISASSLVLNNPLPVASGGTNANNASSARTNLGLAIGTDVQAYNSNLTTWAGKTAPAGAVVGTTDTQALTGKTYNGLNVSTTTGTLTISNGITLALTGSNSATLTTTGPTNVTLPTSGTIVTSGVVTLSSLASVGTLTTGTWNASIVNSTYGGTGVNNGGRTLTYAGNLNFTGAFTQTFNATGNSSVTLPLTGTLATLAGSETLTNKTINGGSISGLATDLAVSDGGTGTGSFTAYGVVTGGTTGTGALQSVVSAGTAGQVLTSNGASALPTFQTISTVFAKGRITALGTTPVVNGGTNITSVVRNGTGQYTVTFASAAANTDYIPHATCRKDTAPTCYASQFVITSTTVFAFQVYDAAGTATDPDQVYIAVFP